MDEAAIGQHKCPSCGATIPHDPRFVSWCDRCGWNVQPQRPAQPRTRFESLYASMGERLGKSLFAQITRGDTLQPRWTLSKLAAFVLAGLVHSLTLLFAILGIRLIVGDRSYPILMAIGVICLLIAWTLRPRVGKMPPGVIRREQFPALYKAADGVAQALQEHHVDAIVLDHRFNASFAQVGWRRRRVLSLGLPLFTVLGAEERVALLAHELAHGVNGDPNRGFFVGTAINSLSTWQYLLRPDRAEATRYRQTNLHVAAVVAEFASHLLSAIPWSALVLLSHLLYRDAQRAEYLADYLATRVSGVPAMLSLLDKLHLSGVYAGTVQSIVVSQGKRDLFVELAGRVATLPPRELERIRRVERLEASRLDATHPPTASRIAFLQGRPVASSAFTLSRIENEQIESELARVHERIQSKIVDQHRRSLYY